MSYSFLYVVRRRRLIGPSWSPIAVTSQFGVATLGKDGHPRRYET